uniref:BURP domain-containing protein n=1 Tax=Tanacetum cinerariifolium TaxID=118510 RepID=A0A6L2K3U1_TANCI|nr:hypothetical protein [Tanacetum cinerariifolium]
MKINLVHVYTLLSDGLPHRVSKFVPLTITSLESMVDFGIARLGKKVKAITTEVKTKKDTSLQIYKLVEGAKKVDSTEFVICRKKNYAYAVFYCHKSVDIKVYVVSLVGDDGRPTALRLLLVPDPRPLLYSCHLLLLHLLVDGHIYGDGGGNGVFIGLNRGHISGLLPSLGSLPFLLITANLQTRKLVGCFDFEIEKKASQLQLRHMVHHGRIILTIYAYT